MREFSTRIVVKLEEDELVAASNFNINDVVVSPLPPPKLEHPTFDVLWKELSLTCGKEKPVAKKFSQRKTEPKGKPSTMRNLTTAFHLAKASGLFDSTRSESKRVGERLSFKRSSKRRLRLSSAEAEPPLTPLLRLKPKSKPGRQGSLGSDTEKPKFRLSSQKSGKSGVFVESSVDDEATSEARTTKTTKPPTRPTFFGTMRRLRTSVRRGSTLDLRDQLELPPSSPKLKPRTRDLTENEASFYKSPRPRQSNRRNRSHGVFTLSRSDSIESGFSKTHPLARREGRRPSKMQATNPRFKKKSIKEVESSNMSI